MWEKKIKKQNKKSGKTEAETNKSSENEVKMQTEAGNKVSFLCPLKLFQLYPEAIWDIDKLHTLFVHVFERSLQV